MFPVGRGSGELKQEADFRIKMSQKLLESAQFPEKIKLGNVVIECPESWK